MKKLVFILLAVLTIAASLQAGERVRSYAMFDSTGYSPDQPIWIEMDSSGVARSVWIFPDKKSGKDRLTQYTGFATFTFRYDTTLTNPVAANLDTNAIAITFLNYDQVDEQYEEPSLPIAPIRSSGNITTLGDTVQVKNDWRWSVTHSDDKYQLSFIANFRTGFHGAKITVTPNKVTDAFRWRVDCEVTEDR